MKTHLSKYCLYLIKLGNNIFEYKHIGVNLSILELNKNRNLSKFPKLNNSDYEMIKNSGGTVLYKKDDITYWLVNIDLISEDGLTNGPLILPDRVLGGISTGVLKNKIINIINSVKLDIKLNQIIK